MTSHALGGIAGTAAGGRSGADVMAAILKVCRHIKNRTLSIDAYTPNFIPIRFETTELWAFLKSVAPTRLQEQQENKFLIQHTASKH